MNAHRGRAFTAVLLAISAGYLASCSSAETGPVLIHIDKVKALIDVPLAITVSGLPSGGTVTLATSASDCHGVRYASRATFTADTRGDLDLTNAAPTSGSYTGAHTMGLLWSMTPLSGSQRAYDFCVPNGGFAVALTAEVAGRVVAHQALMRLWPGTGVSQHDERPSAVGFYGEYFAPSAGGPTRPGLVVFGGSGGGLTTSEAALLASDGYPTLALAYFGEPGLPQTLQSIPLEYFARALNWLAQQPGVDSNRLVVQGVSRGSEAALLLGVYYPGLVHGVIARVTNSVALCGIGRNGRCDGPAWTFRGAPVPYTIVGGDIHPPDDPAAVIPVENINGPILLNCGDRDAVWPSCVFANAVQGLLDNAHFPYPHELFAYPDGGHGVGVEVPPYVPFYYSTFGGTAEATLLARVDFWPRELAFLSALGG